MSGWEKFCLWLFLFCGVAAGAVFVISEYTEQTIFVVVALIVILILVFGFKRRCPNCKKLFALKKTGKKLVNTSDKNIQVENDVYSNNEVKIGHTTQWVRGKRYTYHKNYECRFCGNKSHKTYSKDSVN